MPSQVDTRPFAVGKNLGVTPGQVVHRTEVFELIQYEETSATGSPATARGRPPADQQVLHHRPRARPQPRREHRRRRHPVLHDQLAQPDARAARLEPRHLRHRSPRGHPRRLRHRRDRRRQHRRASVPEASRSRRCSVTSPPPATSELVHSATFLVAGLDTRTETTVTALASRRAVEAARMRSLRKGVLSGDDMARVFAWLRPNDLVWNYWVNNYLLGQNPPAFDILYWNNDTTRLPAGLHSDFLDLYLTNGARRGHARRARHPGRPQQGHVRQLRRRRLHRPHHPVGRRLPDHPGAGRRQHLRPQQRRSHPGDPQPAGQPEGVVPHRRRAAAHRLGVARRRHAGRRARGGRSGTSGSPLAQDPHVRAGDAPGTRPTGRSILRPDAMCTSE